MKQSQSIFHSEPLSTGEHKELFQYLIKESGLFKTKLYIFHKHKETGEKPHYGVRYFERHHQQQLLELFEKGAFDEVLGLPVGEYGRCATKLITRYVDSGKVVGFQIEEARPQEDGRTVYLTPAKIIMNADKTWVDIAKRVDQPMD